VKKIIGEIVERTTGEPLPNIPTSEWLEQCTVSAPPEKMWVRFPPGTVCVILRVLDSLGLGRTSALGLIRSVPLAHLSGFVYVARLPSAPFPLGTLGRAIFLPVLR
jgi:hypothetical protein